MSGWIGVDLDGTLAEYGGWQGCDHIGKPIPAMAARVRDWIAQGQEVRIFTARAYNGDQETLGAIENWSEEHFGVVLRVTCTKDYGMIQLWDDRAVQVETNTGRRADGKP